MKYFIDTSVLIAAASPTHENNNLATALLNKCRTEGELNCLSTHVLAEMYATLSKFGRRVDPKFPLLPVVAIIRRTVAEFHAVTLVEDDYYSAMERCASLGLSSGVVYDALHFQAALKIGADVLYTDNAKDFDRLVTDEKIIIKGIRK